ncbi:GvpL/GvpF family gas vesicle protein [Streptomyces sp. VRA16 Mangrove soil]|uniref:GvpL/GvpF family gas vesicle protein n=1 Tax=Streptomyces sp. VRA16 Mangrove soil TaxID=2817434 RepID=UPI001A9E4EAF|nr:GvpL/GvpF family gas vesicle protein [Streptomyces sp. VRA16 Mangrove soil]MBO1330261.1 GvpL/GvpF family gas vesicle protein [Streptomyces sp. VRA16 Mangrove soil]
MSTYVYGIAAADHPALPDGMEGVGKPALPVRTVTAGGLAAIVSDAPENLRPKRRDLLAHQNVLSEAGGGGTVLPMRFGSVADDDRAVATALEQRAEHYTERLRALHDSVEYNVKVQHDEEAVLHVVMAEHPDVRELAQRNRAAGGGSHEDRLRLGEAVATAVQQREARDAEEVRAALEPHAQDVSPGPESSGWITNLSFLVHRGSSEHLLQAVEEARKASPHLVFSVNGPLPPYSFVEPAPAARAGG